MKILIIGGTSALGSALKPVLSELGEVTTAGRRNCDIRLDLCDPIEAMALPDDIDVIINTAAHFGGSAAPDIVEAENVNVLGALKLCQAAVQAKVKYFVLISSIFARLNDDSQYYGIYSLSKRQAEEATRFFCLTHSLPLAILRPSQVYGAEERLQQRQPIIRAIIEKARKGEDIELYGSRDAWRNYIYIDDLTTVISRVVKSRIVGTYCCQHPSDVTFSRIATAAFEAFKTDGAIRFLKDRPDIGDNVFEKDDSLYEKIGFYPRTSIEEGFRKIARQS
jgi:UDP-glucose 4-epimerase